MSCAVAALVCAAVISNANAQSANGQGAAQKQADATQILAAAKSQATAQHKMIFLAFGASWCTPCKLLDEFWASPDVKPILQKYFVFAELHIEEERGKNPQLNTPGGENLAAKLGAQKETGVPYIVFLNEKGEPLANSLRPVNGHPTGENIGYPVLPEEIAWFVSMLNKAVPSISGDEAAKIESWLRQKAKTLA